MNPAGEIFAATPINQDVAQLTELQFIFGNIVEVVLALAGIVLFIMLLMGGFKYITSGGDPKAVEAAKKTLTYAIGGLILIVLAYLFLKFIATLTGANILNFSLGNVY